MESAPSLIIELGFHLFFVQNRSVNLKKILASEGGATRSTMVARPHPLPGI